LSGVQYGIRYAYDRSPDASYTWRNDLAVEHLDRSEWIERVAWLRAAGVRGIITSEELTIPSIKPIAREATVGIPVTLYAIENARSEVRRATHVLWAKTPRTALSLMREATRRESDTVVVEAASRPLTGGGETRVIRQSADFMQLETNGDGPSALFIARSYTSAIRATVNGQPAAVAPANVHLTAVFVPSGKASVCVSFAATQSECLERIASSSSPNSF
jgi:hypothetical protein